MVRQIDGGAAQPPQSFTPTKFLEWAQKQLTLAEQVFSCYEAGPFGYGLHRKLTEFGLINYEVRPRDWDEYGKKVKTDKRDAKQLGLGLEPVCERQSRRVQCGAGADRGRRAGTEYWLMRGANQRGLDLAPAVEMQRCSGWRAKQLMASMADSTRMMTGRATVGIEKNPMGLRTKGAWTLIAGPFEIVLPMGEQTAQAKALQLCGQLFIHGLVGVGLDRGTDRVVPSESLPGRPPVLESSHRPPQKEVLRSPLGRYNRAMRSR